MAELGSIEKPAVSSFDGKRKLYCVPGVYNVDGSEDFTLLFERFWMEVSRQLEKLETAGVIKKIFCEIIHADSDESRAMLARMNEPLSKLVQRKTGEGALLFPLEDRAIFGTYIDWSNCLRVVSTMDVFQKILGFYTEISGKRFEKMIEIIDKNLGPHEAGLLVLKDEDRTKLLFPADIEVFLVTPPAYDDILKRMRAMPQKAE